MDKDEWIYSDIPLTEDDIFDAYYGKYLKRVGKKEYIMTLSQKHIEQLHLILALCVDQERLNNTNQAKYLYKELRQEVEDIICGGTDNRKRFERMYKKVTDL